MTIRIAILAGLARIDLPPGFSATEIGSAILVHDGAAPIHIMGQTTIIGWAFRRDGFAACEQLDQAETEAIERSSGAWAIRNLWGNFLLTWSDAEGCIHILRSL